MQSAIRIVDKINNKENIEEIFTLDETIMDWVGALNDYYCKHESQFLKNTIFKDKYYMRCFFDGTVEQPKYSEELDEKIKFEVIRKPRKKSCAEGIVLCNSEIKGDKKISSEDYIYEEYISYDQMFTSDGYACNGKIVRFFSHCYDGKILEEIWKHNKREKYILAYTNKYYWSDYAVITRLYEETSRIIEKYAKNIVIPFHFEWFYIKESNSFIFCEGACRFGGSRIPQMITDSFGVDVLGEYWEHKINNISKENVDMEKVLLRPIRISGTYNSLITKGTKKDVSEIDDNSIREFISYVKPGIKYENAKNVSELSFLCRFCVNDWDEFTIIKNKISNYSEATIVRG
jgi:hypothetical protein